jgi:hypothetical protein
MLFKIAYFVILSCKITGTRGGGKYVYRERERDWERELDCCVVLLRNSLNLFFGFYKGTRLYLLNSNTDIHIATGSPASEFKQ